MALFAKTLVVKVIFKNLLTLSAECQGSGV